MYPPLSSARCTKCFGRLPFVLVYLDDILIFSKSEGEQGSAECSGLPTSSVFCSANMAATHLVSAAEQT